MQIVLTRQPVNSAVDAFGHRLTLGAVKEVVHQEVDFLLGHDTRARPGAMCG